MTSCAWTEPEMARLKELADERMSASQIADALCREFGSGRTRNSVIGKIMRGKGQFGNLRQHSPSRASSRATGPGTRPDRPQPAIVSTQSPSPSPAPAPLPLPVPGRVVPVDPPKPLPMTFLEAVLADRCLHFVGDPLGPDGPDMPVCGAERAQDARPFNRYCCRHLESGRAAEVVA